MHSTTFDSAALQCVQCAGGRCRTLFHGGTHRHGHQPGLGVVHIRVLHPKKHEPKGGPVDPRPIGTSRSRKIADRGRSLSSLSPDNATRRNELTHAN